MKRILVLLLVLLLGTCAYADDVSTLANQNLEKMTFDGSGNLNTTNTSGVASNVNVQQNGGVTVCKTALSNSDVTVDNTVGGVTVLTANATRCGAIIQNTEPSAADMRCSAGTPTASAGTYVAANSTLVLGLESQQTWKCIRVTGSSTIANATESRP